MVNKILSLFGVCMQKLDTYPVSDFAWMRGIGFRTILDIGANEGQFAEKISKILPGARLVCFEPLDEAFEILRSRCSGKPGAEFHKCALGSKDERCTIYHNESSASSSLLPMKSIHKENFAFTRNESEETIEVCRLDDLIDGIDIRRPMLMKIDVQGYEMEVIEGGMVALRMADVLIIETSFVQLYENGPLFDDIYKILLREGFVYSGSFEQLRSPLNGVVLQQDAVFVRKEMSDRIYVGKE